MSASEQARAVANAVLYEGFLLFPYTIGAAKNRLRWQFGVVMPQGYHDPNEPSTTQTHLLAQAGSEGARVAAQVRFLQQGDGASTTEREVEIGSELREGSVAVSFSTDVLCGTLQLYMEPDGQFYRLTLEITNNASVSGEISRNEALLHAFIGAHAIFTIERGRFLSLLDPPEEAKAAASRCNNRKIYPVLIGDDADDSQSASTVLASPIILYDFPQLAPQSSVPTFDGTEVDELLMLSVSALTDEEKRAARAGDPRARAIVDRAEAMDAQLQQQLHGRISVGGRVRVHPKRRADAIDAFTDGMTARVHAVHEDIDGRRYVSVLFEGDPASDLHEWYGRSYFYDPDEVEPIGDAP